MSNKIILYEYQKKRVCEFYGCSDSGDKQYPDCTGMQLNRCQLHQIQNLIFELNEPCEHPQAVCVNEEGATDMLCVDCHEQLETEY